MLHFSSCSIQAVQICTASWVAEFTELQPCITHQICWSKFLLQKYTGQIQIKFKWRNILQKALSACSTPHLLLSLPHLQFVSLLLPVFLLRFTQPTASLSQLSATWLHSRESGLLQRTLPQEISLWTMYCAGICPLTTAAENTRLESETEFEESKICNLTL